MVLRVEGVRSINWNAPDPKAAERFYTEVLDGEVARGDWIVVPALPDDVLTRKDAGLWGHVLRRQGMPLALLATYPADVRQN